MSESGLDSKGKEGQEGESYRENSPARRKDKDRMGCLHVVWAKPGVCIVPAKVAPPF